MVKTLNFISVILVLLFNSSYAQDEFHKIDALKYQNEETYKTWISIINNPIKVKGILFEIRDSSIIVNRNLNILIEDDIYLPVQENLSDFTDIPITDIDVIKVRREGKIGKSMLIGTISGFVVGGLIGLIAGDDWYMNAEGKAIIVGLPFAVAGAGIGSLVGSAKITIPINGSIMKYNRNKNKLKRYSAKKYY